MISRFLAASLKSSPVIFKHSNFQGIENEVALVTFPLRTLKVLQTLHFIHVPHVLISRFIQTLLNFPIMIFEHAIFWVIENEDCTGTEKITFLHVQITLICLVVWISFVEIPNIGSIRVKVIWIFFNKDWIRGQWIINGVWYNSDTETTPSALSNVN